ncbi:hypothetical protein LTR85_009751 [Meristemomyces frigidus]|nr:hypothetical protein LTR85_009751 [Meristemomyces frigidus]
MDPVRCATTIAVLSALAEDAVSERKARLAAKATGLKRALREMELKERKEQKVGNDEVEEIVPSSQPERPVQPAASKHREKHGC